ncbi:MAG: nucleotidyltransferase [Thaumarchaeota archaeon]|nr:nucleotidyltransferase [Nitrososphaerota archaeon]MDE0265740.1 nucleotidyltransferase [Nitrososphaerota archaeon]MDE0525463.1 nucleotidyltransferase [Nitrososphaerota archaeon]
MNPIISEAIRISRDFEGATFVGAVAVMLHAREQRQSTDIDFVVIERITDAEFLEKGYTIDTLKNKKFTPGGFKIDVYHERDLNCIPLKHIVETAATIPVDKNGTTVRIISLEGLIVSKFGAGRDADVEDLQWLAV